MKRRWKVSVSVAVLFMLLLGGWRINEERTMKASKPRADAPTYGRWGPYAVGTREDRLTIDGGLTVRLWYPADGNPAAASTMRYPHQLKWFLPIGFAARVAGNGIENAPFADNTEPYPVVVLTPGFAIGNTAYVWLAERLASHGFVVISPEHREVMTTGMEAFWKGMITRPEDVRAVIDYVESETTDGARLEGTADPTRMAVLGHSLGGYTALALAGARLDSSGMASLCANAQIDGQDHAWLCDMILPNTQAMAELAGLAVVPAELWPDRRDVRIRAVVSMAGDSFPFGRNGLAAVRVPVLALGGTADTGTPPEWGTDMTYDHVSSQRKTKVGLVDGEHMLFLDDCEAMPFFGAVYKPFCSDTTWQMDVAHDLIAHFVVAFLQTELAADESAAEALDPLNVDIENVKYEAVGYR